MLKQDYSLVAFALNRVAKIKGVDYATLCLARDSLAEAFAVKDRTFDVTRFEAECATGAALKGNENVAQ